MWQKYKMHQRPTFFFSSLVKKQSTWARRSNSKQKKYFFCINIDRTTTCKLADENAVFFTFSGQLASSVWFPFKLKKCDVQWVLPFLTCRLVNSSENPSSSIRSDHANFDYSAVAIHYLFPRRPPLGRLWQKSWHGIFSMCNNVCACCAHEAWRWDGHWWVGAGVDSEDLKNVPSLCHVQQLNLGHWTWQSHTSAIGPQTSR